MINTRNLRIAIIVAVIFCLAGCRQAPLPPVPSATTPIEPTAAVSTTVPPPLEVSPSPEGDLATATEPGPSATPDVYWLYTIDYLSERSYGGGEFEILEVYATNSWFTRYIIRYSSDGLWIHGFLNVPVNGGPAGEGPFPAVVALHGYIDPAIYDTIDYTTGYADALARAGYIVFHPNLRGYPPSDSGDNLFRVGMALDVLNLLALIGSDIPEMDEFVDLWPGRIGLWGHSMGGGISTRVLTVSDDVQAAVLYAPMSGDERQNFEGIYGWSDQQRGLEELAVPPDELLRISPMYFFDRISAAVQIHHGRADELVPLAWSLTTCGQMEELALDLNCFFYDGMPHTFVGDGDLSFIQNTITFLDEVLKRP